MAGIFDNINGFLKSVSDAGQAVVDSVSKVEKGIVATSEGIKNNVGDLFSGVHDKAENSLEYFKVPSNPNTPLELGAYFNRGTIELIVLVGITGAILYYVVKK